MGSKYMEGEEVFKKEASKEFRAEVTADGYLSLPPEISKMLGIVPGSQFRIITHQDRIEVFPNIHSLGRLYIEPTLNCNLSCRTCVRQTWNESIGMMETRLFDQLVAQLQEFHELRSVMFGGFGEPTTHPDILNMIDKIKSLGLQVEMVTNGTLVNETMLKGLLENHLDILWVSFDGTTAENYDNVRSGASFNEVVANLKLLKELMKGGNHQIKVGIAFVVTKNNIKDLPKLEELARVIGAKMISVSNVLPYSREMAGQMLCESALIQNKFRNAPYNIAISLPLIDQNNLTKEAWYALLKENKKISIMTNPFGVETSKCRFIKERTTFVRWDGAVSPCMGLLHSYKTYLDHGDFEREITGYILGNIADQNLKKIWDGREYHDFRERVAKFDFSPCYACGGCDFSEKNNEDCFGNNFPTCGGCLWGQGVIQCP